MKKLLFIIPTLILILSGCAEQMLQVKYQLQPGTDQRRASIEGYTKFLQENKKELSAETTEMQEMKNDIIQRRTTLLFEKSRNRRDRDKWFVFQCEQLEFGCKGMEYDFALEQKRKRTAKEAEIKKQQEEREAENKKRQAEMERKKQANKIRIAKLIKLYKAGKYSPKTMDEAIEVTQPDPGISLQVKTPIEADGKIYMMIGKLKAARKGEFKFWGHSWVENRMVNYGFGAVKPKKIFHKKDLALNSEVVVVGRYWKNGSIDLLNKRPILTDVYIAPLSAFSREERQQVLLAREMQFAMTLLN